MIKQFEKRISELGFSHQIIPDGSYILCKTDDVEARLKVQLICSKAADQRKYGSHNNNQLESIGLYRFKLSVKTDKTDFIVFVFKNIVKESHEFVIVPTGELKRRLSKSNSILVDNHKFTMVFWLMPDGFIYDCTDISIEGEWFYLSLGINGRMIDGSIWDYTEYLNAWDSLQRI